jgi:hypothetical protein
MLRFAVGAGGLLLLAGCSSSWLPNMDLRMGSFGSSTLELRVESEPAGAEAKTSLGPSCRTPCVVAVAARGDFSVTFTREGFLPQSVTVQLLQPADPRVDPEGPPNSATLSPNPLLVELQPAPPPPRKQRRNAKTRRPPPQQAPALR